MRNGLNVAMAQFPHDVDPADIIADASRANAEIVVFPEMYSNGHAHFDPTNPESIARWRAGAVAVDSDFVATFREAARRNQIYVVATFLEFGNPDPFNSALLIDPSGETVLHHRKVYLCDFDVPEQACGRGEQFDVARIETSAGTVTVGLMICMDREFPEAGRSHSSKGAEIVLVPNCCMLVDGSPYRDVRIAQARGRAFEMVMGIAVANYPSPRCDGHSFAVGETGTMLAIADTSACLATATFDLGAIRKRRAQDRFRWAI